MKKNISGKKLVEIANKKKGKGQAKAIFNMAKQAYKKNMKKTGLVLWGIGKTRIKFLQKVKGR